MYELVIGFFLGILGTNWLSKRPRRDMGTQADNIWGTQLQISEPVPVVSSKFVPKLTNFWGPDS
jgi:hypothetical protein